MGHALSRWIGAALLEFVLDLHEQFEPHVHDLTEWLREAARPPEGVVLGADDGALYTGIVVVNENRPVAALVIRHGPHSGRRRTFGFSSQLADDSDFNRSLWREDDPFGR